MVRSWLSTALAALAATTLFTSVASAASTVLPLGACATVAPEQPQMPVESFELTVGTHPFGLVYYSEDIAFAAVMRSVLVLDTSKFVPRILHNLTMPSNYDIGNISASHDSDDFYAQYHGVKLSWDRENLYVAAGYGAVILDVRRALRGASNSYVGLLSYHGLFGNNSVEVSLSPDDQYVFLSQELGSELTLERGAIEVWHVNKSAATGAITGTHVGVLPLGYAVVSQEFSPDRTRLFVTSELSLLALPGFPLTQEAGTISVLDVATLTTDPSNALLYTVPSGCHPVRCALGPDGKYLWVTTREGNELLAYDVALLATNETAALGSLVSRAQTGTSPVSIAFVGSQVLTADSNRFDYANTSTGITVVDSALALNEGPTHVFAGPSSQIAAGAFPREIAVSPSQRRMLISNYDSGFIQVVNTTGLLI
ncbi:cytochrome cd1-nitrite reductase-like protein [Xylariales sp. PMI_506]|nr:cytochrome cd1-nitrite reductase-like protein [Xylariales sp. PMI_506]